MFLLNIGGIRLAVQGWEALLCCLPGLQQTPFALDRIIVGHCMGSW